MKIPLRKRIKTTALLLCAAFVLSGCSITDAYKTFRESFNAEDVGIASEGKKEAEVSNSISLGLLDFDTFNPLLTTSQTVRECMQLVYEPLFTTDEKLCPVPVLAQSYTVSADGRTIDITIKDGVLWQDGSYLTAYDAAYTIKQIRSGITQYTESLANVADYSALDDNLLRIKLNYAVPNFVSLLSFPIVKYQSEMKVNANYIPMGTGPFRYDSQISSGKLLFTAYDGYYGGRASIDTVNVYVIPDMEKYKSMFEANELDIITGDTVDLSEYMPHGSARSTEYITNKMTFLGFNCASPILNDSETRKGLAELIDKDGIMNSVLYSRGVACDAPINPSSLFYYDTNTKFTADENSALEHLGNGGWGVGHDGRYTRTASSGTKQILKLEILTDEGSAERVSIAEKIAADFTYFGIPVEVTALPYKEYEQKIADMDYDMFIGEIEIAANLDLTPLVSSAGNYFSYYNPELDTLSGQLGMTQDIEQQKVLFRQYGTEITDDMPFSVLFYRKSSVLTSSKIKSEISPSIGRAYRNSQLWSVKE